jgi:hypothetical protein
VTTLRESIERELRLQSDAEVARAVEAEVAHLRESLAVEAKAQAEIAQSPVRAQREAELKRQIYAQFNSDVARAVETEVGRVRQQIYSQFEVEVTRAVETEVARLRPALAAEAKAQADAAQSPIRAQREAEVKRQIYAQFDSDVLRAVEKEVSRLRTVILVEADAARVKHEADVRQQIYAQFEAEVARNLRRILGLGRWTIQNWLFSIIGNRTDCISGVYHFFSHFTQIFSSFSTPGGSLSFLHFVGSQSLSM